MASNSTVEWMLKEQNSFFVLFPLLYRITRLYMSSIAIWLFIKGLLHQDQRIHYHFIGTCIAQRTQSISISTYWINKRRIDWFRPMLSLDWMMKGKVYMFAYSIYENGSVIDRLGNLLSFLPPFLLVYRKEETFQDLPTPLPFFAKMELFPLWLWAIVLHYFLVSHREKLTWSLRLVYCWG